MKAKKLIYRDDEKAIKRLADAENAIDIFLKKHPGKLKDSERAELRPLLNERAKALGNAIGYPVHSLFEDD